MKETWEKVNRYRRRGHVEEGAHGCVESRRSRCRRRVFEKGMNLKQNMKGHEYSIRKAKENSFQT